jgi:hypothetical protein
MESKSSEFKQIIDLLPILSNDELREVGMRATALARPESNRIDPVIATTIHEQMISILREKGIRNLPHPATLFGGQTDSSIHFYKTARALSEYVQANFTGLTKAQTFLLYHNLLCLTVTYIMQSPVIPLSFRSLCQQALNIEEIVNQEFPSYQESGLLSVALLGRKLHAANPRNTGIVPNAAVLR